MSKNDNLNAKEAVELTKIYFDEIQTLTKDVTNAVHELDTVRQDYLKKSWGDIIKNNVGKIVLGAVCLVAIIMVIKNDKLIIKIGSFEVKSSHTIECPNSIKN